jgi:hypothetical protein
MILPTLLALQRTILRTTDTSGFTGGDELYLSASVAGEFVGTKPTGANYVVPLGTVLNSHPSTGSILVHLGDAIDWTHIADVGTLIAGTVDINGGNIDGTTVGGTTPAAGTFSTLTGTTINQGVNNVVDDADIGVTVQPYNALTALTSDITYETLDANGDVGIGATQLAQGTRGVTNGDTHDHSGGDGAQINHTTLSNIGVNTHAQIDTHIADATIHFTQAAISITESQISDFGSYIPTSEKAAANGVATLDAGSKVPTSQLPALALTEVNTVANEAAQLALTCHRYHGRLE